MPASSGAPAGDGANDGGARLDDDRRRPDELGVELEAGSGEADGADMRAGRDPVEQDDRLGGMRRRRDDVGAAHRLLERGCGCADLGRQLLRLRPVAAGDADLVPVADARERTRMRARLDAGAEDGEHARVVPRQQARGERRRAGGARGGDVRPVHQRERRAVRRVEERDRRLVRRPVGVVREDGDELAAEPGRREIARHRAEQAVVLGEGRDPRRHRGGARRELRVGARERVDELVEIEQLLHLRAGEHEHPP